MKVSIIIPIYNASKFLERCLNSIINQTYKNIEIIAIDDGSQDDSIKILENFKKNHKKVFSFYTQENRGVGQTRNRGIELAKGEYIVFIDADDYIKNDYIETLVKNISNYDAVFSGYLSVNINGEVLSTNPLDKSDWSKYKYNGILGKIYKVKYLKINNIKYPNYKVGEDLYFSMLLINSKAKINTIEYCGYYYVQNSTSATNSIKQKYDMLPIFQNLYSEIKNNNFDIKKISHFFIKTMLFSLILQRKILSSKEMNNMFNNTMRWIKSINKNIGFFNYKLESLSIRIIVNLFIAGYYLKLTNVIFKIVKIF